MERNEVESDKARKRYTHLAKEGPHIHPWKIPNPMLDVST
jgi:hypothetical protein